MEYERVAFISDTRGRFVMTQNLVDMLHDYGVGTVVHLGDLDCPYVAELFSDFDFRAVFGNHDRPRDEIQNAVSQNGEHLGNESMLSFSGNQFFVFHGQNTDRAENVANYPNGIQYVVHGHQDEALRERYGNGEVLVPGVESAWVYDGQHDKFAWATLNEARAWDSA